MEAAVAGEAPPPGMSADLWAGLGPEAKAAAVQRYATAQAGPGPAEAAIRAAGGALTSNAPPLALSAEEMAQLQANPVPTTAPAPAPAGGAVLGRSGAVPVEQQDAFSRWVSQDVVPGVKQAFSSTEPLFQVPGTDIGKPAGAPTTIPEVTVEGKAPQTWGAGAPQFVTQAAPAQARPVTVPAHATPLYAPEDIEGLVGKRVFNPVTGKYEGPLVGGAYGAQQAAVGERKEAATEIGRVQGVAGEREALGKEGEKQELTGAAQEVRKLESEREKLLQGYRDKMDEYSKKLYKVDPETGESRVKIDPERGWKNLDAFDKVRYTLAGALFGFLQGMGKISGNPAFEKIQALNAADVDAQKHEFEMAKGRGADLNTHYAQAFRETGDKLEATKLALGYGLESAKAESDRLLAKSKSQLAPAAAAEVRAQLSEHQATIGTAQAADKMKSSKWVPAATTGGAGAVPKKDQDLIFAGPDGKMYKARNKESRDKLAVAGAGMADLIAAADEYERNVGKVGVASKGLGKLGVVTEDSQAAVTSYGKLQDAARKAANMGTPQAAELAIMATRIPPPDQWSGSVPVALGALKAGARTTFTSSMAAEAPLPVEEAVTAAGPVQAYTGKEYRAPPTKVPGFKPAGAK